MLNQGKSPQQVIDFMVERYGDFVLYRPQFQSNTYLLWLGPFVLLLLGVLVLFVSDALRAAGRTVDVDQASMDAGQKTVARRRRTAPMTFWIVAIALIVVALLILLLPLLRASRYQAGDEQRRQQNVQIAREQKQLLKAQLDAGEIDQAAFDSAYLDLQAALALELEQKGGPGERLTGSWMALVILLLLPGLSIPLYFVYGEYRVVADPRLAQQAPPAQAAQQMSMDEMVTAIKEKLRQNPEDAEGWFMLGRTMMSMQQFDQAVTAFQRSNDLLGNEPGIMFALADALAMQNNGSLLGEPEALVQRGLELAPMFPNGLWLAGMAAEQRQDYKAAHAYWTRLLPMIRDNPDSTREIRSLLALLEERDPSLVQAAVGGRQLNLSIDISPQLKSQADPESAVFVYARAMQGPPMPLAVKKLRLADLPLSLTLSDDDAMMPAMKLSSFDQVVVGARVSPSGNPVAQAGDFFTERDAIDSANPPDRIELVIDRIK